MRKTITTIFAMKKKKKNFIPNQNLNSVENLGGSSHNKKPKSQFQNCQNTPSSFSAKTITIYTEKY